MDPRDKDLDKRPLAEIIDEELERELTDSQANFLNQLQIDTLENEQLSQQARENSRDEFTEVFDAALVGLFVTRLKRNRELFEQVAGDDDFRKYIEDRIAEVES